MTIFARLWLMEKIARLIWQKRFFHSMQAKSELLTK